MTHTIYMKVIVKNKTEPKRACTFQLSEQLIEKIDDLTVQHPHVPKQVLVEAILMTAFSMEDFVVEVYK